MLAAASNALGASGLSASASRTTTGNRPEHEALERSLERFMGLERAVLLPEGYLANLALCQALAPDRRTAIVDERAHRSLWDAAAGTGMRVVPYRHLDVDHAGALARQHLGSGVVVLTDSVFTATGEVAPVRGLLECLPEGALLVTDDCHGLGVRGRCGRGSRDREGIDDPRLLVTSTLAKGVGCYGGAVLGAAALVEGVRSVPAYVCTTPIPPALAAAAVAALGVMGCDRARHERLAANARLLEAGLVGLGLATARAEPIPIFALAPAGVDLDEVQRVLAQRGAAAPVMRYPGGPAARYVRLSVTAEHSKRDIGVLLEGLGEACARAAEATVATPRLPAPTA